MAATTLYTFLEEKQIPFLREEPLKNHTTFKIGGPTPCLIEPTRVEEVAQVVRYCRENGVETISMGNGSNLLVPDEGISQVVIKLGKNLSAMRREGDAIVCQAGASLTKLCHFAAEEGLSGLSDAFGIPGNVGGALFMNAGAYDFEMKQVVRSAIHVDESGKVCTLTADEMGLSYRHSAYQGQKSIICEVTFALTPGDGEAIKARMAEVMGRRVAKQPLEFGSAGSTFKRPKGAFAGALIQQCGLRGYTVGDAMVSEKHCGFVINKGSASCADVKAVIRHVQQTVLKKTGYTLECEVRML